MVFEHKRPLLQLDRPLLEQRDKIEELRHSLDSQRPAPISPNFPQLPNHSQHSGSPEQVILLGQSGRNGIASDKANLMQQVNNLALQPLINQGPLPQWSPKAAQLIKDVRQPLVLGQQSHPGSTNDHNQAVLLGQRVRAQTTASQPAQAPQLAQQHLTYSWQTGLNADHNNGDHQVAKRQEGRQEGMCEPLFNHIIQS